jgi:hypothetical protein
MERETADIYEIGYIDPTEIAAVIPHTNCPTETTLTEIILKSGTNFFVKDNVSEIRQRLAKLDCKTICRLFSPPEEFDKDHPEEFDEDH